MVITQRRSFIIHHLELICRQKYDLQPFLLQLP